MTGTVLLAARVVLFAVFCAAGVAKLADLPGTRAMVREFGLPRVLAGPIAFGLPVVELAVALALLPAESAAVAGFAAVGLLASFSVLVGASLARGRRPDCHCFGQRQATPVGWSTLARNLPLA